MNFFRQYITPLIVVLIFLLALVAVSARIFLPSDMAAPAPVGIENLTMMPQFHLNQTIGDSGYQLDQLDGIQQIPCFFVGC
jgi:hypothetical protein